MATETPTSNIQGAIDKMAPRTIGDNSPVSKDSLGTKENVVADDHVNEPAPVYAAAAAPPSFTQEKGEEINYHTLEWWYGVSHSI